MKAEHRKTLERNTLVEGARHFYEGMRQKPSRGTLLWGGLILLGIILFFTWRYFSRSSAESNSARWRQLDEVVFPEQLDALTQDPKLQGTQQARLARFKEARRQLQDGLRLLGNKSNRPDAIANIREATTSYEELLKDTHLVPLLKQEALAGAARGRETLGDLDAAHKWYEQLVKEFPKSALGKDAEKQLARLDDPANKQDLQDLAREYAPRDKGE
jgi:hypothetical protein